MVSTIWRAYFPSDRSRPEAHVDEISGEVHDRIAILLSTKYSKYRVGSTTSSQGVCGESYNINGVFVTYGHGTELKIQLQHPDFDQLRSLELKLLLEAEALDLEEERSKITGEKPQKPTARTLQLA